MKILHIETGRHLAGGPQQVVTLMKGLEKLGVDSTLLCPDDSAVAILAKEAQLKVKKVPYKGEHDFSLAKVIKDTALDRKFDLMHAHSRRGADHYTAFAARRSKVPAILTRRVINMENGLLAGIKYRSFQRIVAVSEAVDRSLKRQRVVASSRKLIYDGIEPQDYSAPYTREQLTQEFNLPDNAIVMGNVGRFTENKAQLSLLQAFTLINEALPNLHLILFGDGEMLDELIDYVSHHNLSDQVHFAGFRNDMPKWYASLDMLVHTASLEALSVALLEASISGLPLIAYNNGGISEIIRHTFNGLLVQSNAIDQLARAIERLVKKPRMRQQMGKVAKENCEKYFTAERMAQQYKDLYQEVLDEAK